MPPVRRSKVTEGTGKKAADAAASGEGATIGMLTSGIRNKVARSEAYQKLKKIKEKEKRKSRARRQKEASAAESLGQEPARKRPRTIENTREADETLVQPGDADVAAEEQQDEFAAHFNNERPPKVLLTTCYKPTGIMYKFCADLMTVFPDAVFYNRQGYPLKRIVDYASSRGFSDVVVVNEDRREVNGMTVVHLPDGPTAVFKLSSMVLNKDIKGHGRPTSHRPELVLNNFGTRLGLRVGRMFASLFNQDPNFRGRRVVTFHNQRDFIFFRHHRYIFEEKDEKVTETKVTAKGTKKTKVTGTKQVVKARLQELGPRFTLKLLSVQKGTFDSKTGEFEFVHRRGEMDTSRRKFHL